MSVQTVLEEIRQATTQGTEGMRVGDLIVGGGIAGNEIGLATSNPPGYGLAIVGGVDLDQGAIFALSQTVYTSIEAPVSGTGGFVVRAGGTITVDDGNASAVGGAATISPGKMAGKVTTEALTTAQGATYTLTITNTKIAAADIVFASLTNGTNTQGTPQIVSVAPGAGSLVIKVKNMNDSAEALNGTLVVSFMACKT